LSTSLVGVELGDVAEAQWSVVVALYERSYLALHVVSRGRWECSDEADGEHTVVELIDREGLLVEDLMLGPCGVIATLLGV